MIDGMLCTGGPRSRTRRERLQATVMGNDRGFVRCPRRRKVGILFPEGVDALALVYGLCAHLGYADPDDARRALAHHLPKQPMVAMPSQSTPTVVWPEEDAPASEALLVEALLLGMCTAHLYDPTRPVLWTRSSLGRRLELFSTEGFYAA